VVTSLPGLQVGLRPLENQAQITPVVMTAVLSSPYSSELFALSCEEVWEKMKSLGVSAVFHE
jgi:hypothetical protein